MIRPHLLLITLTLLFCTFSIITAHQPDETDKQVVSVKFTDDNEAPFTSDIVDISSHLKHHKRRSVSTTASPRHHSWFPLSTTSHSQTHEKDLLPFLDSISDIKRDIVDKKIATVDYTATTSSDAEVFVAGYCDRGSCFIHLFFDPRVERLHKGHHQENHLGKKKATDQHHHPDKFHTRSSSIERFWLPKSVSALFLLSSSNNKTNKTTKITSLDLLVTPYNEFLKKKKRSASSQQTSSGASPELITISQAGPPETQYSIVLLSAGYLASQRDMFIQNATDIAKMMNDPAMDPADPNQDTSDAAHDMHVSVPFNRYWSFWNVYAVFEPSKQVGASRPLINLNVDNNLKCVHPAEIERAVSCDRELSIALAAVSPAPILTDPERVVVINVVNTHIYGGSAIFIKNKLRLGSFFNGFYLPDQQDYDRMLSLVDHEIGHALGNLMDEYSIGVSESADREILNCQKETANGGPPEGSALQWNLWRSAAAVAGSAAEMVTRYGNGLRSASALSEWSVLQIPSRICGFTNYYKPNTNCMMHRLNDYFMCPVCREQATLQVMENNFQYDWPRFPFRDQVLVIYDETFLGAGGGKARYFPTMSQILNTSSTVVLHLNRVLTIPNGFTISAFDGGTVGGSLTITSTDLCPACITIGPSNFANYPRNQEVRIRVTITDSTNKFVMEQSKTPNTRTQLTQNTFFRLVIVDRDFEDLPTEASLSGISSTPSSSNDTTTTAAPSSSTTTTASPSQPEYSLLFNYSSATEMRSSNYRFGVDLSDLTPRVVLCLTANRTFETRLSQTAGEKNASFCEANLTRSSPYSKPADFGGLIVTFDTWVPIVSAGLGIAFVALWLWACNSYSEKSDGKIRLIFNTELSWFLSLIRNIMLFSSVIVLLVAVAAVGVSVYIYYNTSVLGKILVVVGIVLGVLLYIIAFIGFWAVMSRSKKMLIFNAFVLAIPLAALLFLLITFQQLGSDLDISNGWGADLIGGGGGGGGGDTTTTTTTTTLAPATTTAPATTSSPSSSNTSATTVVNTINPATTATTSQNNDDSQVYSLTQAPKARSAWMDRIEQFWIWLVAEESEFACSIQGMLECSGYYTSCSGTLGSTTTCPKNCEATNERYFSPCQALIQRYIVEHYSKVMLALAICVIVVGISFILDIINLILLWRQKKKLQEEQAARIKRVEEQMAKARAAMKEQQGSIASAAHANKALFLLRSLETPTRRTLIREIKRIAQSKGGSFNMSKKELTNFFKQSMAYVPPKKEVDEIFELAETKSDGVLSIKEFLIVFGWSIKEFKSVPAPPPPKGMLTRAASIAKQRTLSLSGKNKSPKAEEEGAVKSKKYEKEGECEDDDEEMKQKKKKRASGDLGASFGDMMDSQYSDGEDDQSEDEDEAELRRKRHAMRRRSSRLLGSDILSFRNQEGENGAEGLPVAPGLSPQADLDLLSDDDGRSRTVDLRKSVSNLKELQNDGKHEVIVKNRFQPEGKSKDGKELAPRATAVVIPVENNRTSSPGSGGRSRSTANAGNLLAALAAVASNQKQSQDFQEDVPESPVQQVTPLSQRAAVEEGAGTIRHANQYTRNKHSLFAVPPPPRAQPQIDHAHPPRIFDNNNNRNMARSGSIRTTSASSPKSSSKREDVPPSLPLYQEQFSLSQNNPLSDVQHSPPQSFRRKESVGALQRHSSQKQKSPRTTVKKQQQQQQPLDFSVDDL